METDQYPTSEITKRDFLYVATGTAAAIGAAAAEGVLKQAQARRRQKRVVRPRYCPGRIPLLDDQENHCLVQGDLQSRVSGGCLID
ncbi:ubiquinol-cytochrome c reductase iron-sulfur subunit N-terminal domain-containing protein [Chelativorans xinjiangense]|uniref:ubiquinol-cytochrome c reductase iron-sulfur subunit N-terminal domain-containing protein n=1 Tax=Chelativorans xinjiangense TaxID=2681485 RepID=UPI00135A9849|nr:ubiquinol-cytochrome c reductase iron-sulfur subunit N-terminal domain-containing protein [Chelativorans xinjiangense]